MKLTTIKTLLFAVIGLFLVTDTMAQTWQIGYQTMTFVDATRNNRQIETEIYYPADVAGNGNDFGSPIDKKFPLIVYGHDENTGWNHYEYVKNRFASQGFIVAFPKTEAGAVMDVVEYAKDMAFVAGRIRAMRYVPGSFFYKRYNLKSCFMGHGTGGSAATFAVQYHPTVTTLVTLAATETVPSAINASTLVTIPSVVIGGGLDCVSPIATNQMPMFDNIDSDCKTFVNMFEATHCHFAQDAVACTTAQSSCTPSANIWQNTAIYHNYLVISFLRYYMKSNAPALAKFEWKLDSKQQDWSYIFDCNLSAPRITLDDESEEMENTTRLAFYPNPVSSGSNLTLSLNAEESVYSTVIITNLMGQVVSQREITIEDNENIISVSTDNLKSGYYMVSVINEEGRISKPLIIQ